MSKVKITVIDSRCRSGYCKAGDEFIVEDLCPPMCHELWNVMYPMLYALMNGATLDHGSERARCFDAKCPDEGRVVVHVEVMDKNASITAENSAGGLGEYHDFS